MKGRAVTTKSDFSEEEWSRIVRAPFVAGLAISLADPSGPIEAAKESVATVKSATNPSSREQLVTEVALDIQAEVQQKRNPLKGYRPSLEGTAPSGEQVLVELSAVQAICCGSGDPRGDGGVRPVAGRLGASRRQRRQGGRFRGVRRGAGQQGREGDAGPGARRGLTGLTGPGAKSICSTRTSAIEWFCCPGQLTELSGARRRVRLRDRPGRVCDVDLIWEQVVVDAHDSEVERLLSSVLGASASRRAAFLDPEG
jgi:hypothetical protein